MAIEQLDFFFFFFIVLVFLSSLPGTSYIRISSFKKSCSGPTFNHVCICKSIRLCLVSVKASILGMYFGLFGLRNMSASKMVSSLAVLNPVFAQIKKYLMNYL